MNAHLAVWPCADLCILDHDWQNPGGKNKTTLYGIDFAAMTQKHPDSGTERPIMGYWQNQHEGPVFKWEEFIDAMTAERPYPPPQAIAGQQPAAQHGTRVAASGCQPSADGNGETIGSQPSGGSKPNELYPCK